MPRSSGKRVGERAASGGFHVILAVWALISVFPPIWAVITAFKGNDEVFATPWDLPKTWHWDNFARAWGAASIGTFFVNTVIVVASSLLLTMLLSTMVAYVVARYSFPGNRFVYYLFAGGLMFPVFLALVPLYFVVRNLGKKAHVLVVKGPGVKGARTAKIPSGSIGKLSVTLRPGAYVLSDPIGVGEYNVMFLDVLKASAVGGKGDARAVAPEVEVPPMCGQYYTP